MKAIGIGRLIRTSMRTAQVYMSRYSRILIARDVDEICLVLRLGSAGRDNLCLQKPATSCISAGTGCATFKHLW
jgi:hypothetical protein